MKRGINQLCFPRSFPVERMLDLCAEAGFEGFELSVGEEGEVSYRRAPSVLEDLSCRASGRGVELHSISTILHWKYSLSSEDPETRGRGMEVATFMLRAASVVGADAVLLVPGVAESGVPYRRTYEISQESLRALSGVAEELGVRIGVENVWNRFLQGPLEMLRYVEEIGSPWVGVYLDVGNLMNVGYPQHWIQILSDHLVKVHVKDFVGEVGNIHGFTRLLHGDVPWGEVVRELKDVGYDGYLTAELSAPEERFAERLTRQTAESMAEITKGDG